MTNRIRTYVEVDIERSGSEVEDLEVARAKAADYLTANSTSPLVFPLHLEYTHERIHTAADATLVFEVTA